MKISPSEIELITDIIDVAKVLGLDNLVIANGRVSGIDVLQEVVLFDINAGLKLQVGEIALSRIRAFVDRYKLMSGRDGFEIDAEIDTRIDKSKVEVSFVCSMTLKSYGMKVDYRCANPIIMRVPKDLNTNIQFRFSLSDAVIKDITTSIQAMQAENIIFDRKEGKFGYCLVDPNGDELTQDLGEIAEIIEDAETILYKYPIKHFSALIKAADELVIGITTDGLMEIQIKGYKTYIIPKVGQ